VAHQDIAVRNSDPIVRRRAPAFDDIVELRIRALVIVADQEARIDSGIFGDQAAHQRRRRLVSACRAKDQLVAWVIEQKG
jgi:hypothetical protein